MIETMSAQTKVMSQLVGALTKEGKISALVEKDATPQTLEDFYVEVDEYLKREDIQEEKEKMKILARNLKGQTLKSYNDVKERSSTYEE